MTEHQPDLGPAAPPDLALPLPDPHTRPAAQDSAPKRRASPAFLLRHLGHFIALGAGSGLSPVAPGTVGTLWAWASYLMLGLWLDSSGWAWVIGLGLVIGWWACTLTARHAGIADPGFIVWDEIIAFWIVLWVITPAGLGLQLAAFLLFRYFDAAKPGPVGWADRYFKGGGWRGGFGIIFDDLIAALCTLLVLAVWIRWQG
ncbi:MAG: phosphatidylglycerophosphatase A [Burkholderiales bacterium]|nr:phosphatidylglycerophosphatase A [Burkholderiales bacterium]